MEGPEFFASEKWGGVRMGYVYTTGARGLGYYRDAAKDRTAPIKNPLLRRAAPRKRDGASRKEIWEKARTDTSAESKSGGREGRSIEDRLKNAGLLNEVTAVKEKEAEEKDKAAKQAALFQAAAENPGAVPYIPAGEFKGAKVGYVFKLGDDGVGYYLDDKVKAEEAHSQALMVIPQEEKKVNNLLYQLALRGGATQNDDGEIVYPYDALAAVQAIERLTRPGHKFMNLNPFHVLELPQEHDVAQLKEAFGKLNALLDPEKNTDARSAVGSLCAVAHHQLFEEFRVWVAGACRCRRWCSRPSARWRTPTNETAPWRPTFRLATRWSTAGRSGTKRRRRTGRPRRPSF